MLPLNKSLVRLRLAHAIPAWHLTIERILLYLNKFNVGLQKWSCFNALLQLNDRASGLKKTKVYYYVWRLA